MSAALADPARLRALARTELMDSGPEEVFDRLTRLAARLLGAPVALVSLVDGERQFFKSAVGMELRETPLTHSFCRHVVADQAPLTVDDARLDPRVMDNGAVCDLGVIAYAGVPLTDDDGNTLGAFCVIQDTPRRWADEDVALLRELARGVITELELRAANRALREAERRTRMIIENAHQAFFAVDGDGVIADWNPAAERMFGWSVGEVIGRTVADTIVPPRVRRREGSRVVWSSTTGLPRRLNRPVQLRAVDRSGGERTVEMTISEVATEDGAVFNVFVRDVSKVVRMDAVRRAAEQRLRAAIDHAPIGVAIIDLDPSRRGAVISANGAFNALIGDSESSPGPASLGSIVHLDDLDALHRNLVLLCTDGRARTEMELRCVHRDGHVVWLSMTGSIVPETDQTARYAVFHAIDISDRKQFEGQLQYLADHDPLTGLYNRRRFEEELTRAVTSSDRFADRGAVLLLDLDGFKHVNDSMGHSCGDEVVKRVAAILRESLRDADVIARLGGDEFAIILGHADEREAIEVAETLLDGLRSRAIPLSGERSVRVTASIGVTTFDADTRLSTESLLVEADVAMYEAKERSRDAVVAYRRDAAPPPAPGAGQSWFERLTDALARERFTLLAQPVLPICAEPLRCYELLLRLRGDDDTLIAPNAFLHVAERCDLIQQIDRWVFAQATQLLHAAHAAGHDLTLSVNMSGRTLGDPRILADLSALLAETPVPESRLIVEVTETAAIVNIDKARAVARGLRELGCQFALDDFGAGFASFFYLKHLEFDFLKIDGEYIRALPHNTTDQLVVKSLVQIARELGARTIAEFVGDAETVTYLRELGVDYGQGYHLGMPQPLSVALAPDPGGAADLTALGAAIRPRDRA